MKTLPNSTPLIELGPVESLDKFIQEKDMESLEPRSGGAEQYPTPLTDAALDRFVEEGAFAIFPLMRQLERDRAALWSALEDIEMESRKGGQWGFDDINERARLTLAKLR